MLSNSQYNFINLDFETKQGLKFLPKILILIDKHKSFLLDDYIKSDYESLINFVKALSPYFYAVTKDNDFIGFIYITEIEGNKDKTHSVHISACSEKSSYGKDNKNVLQLFMKYLYEDVGVVKIYAKTMKHNQLCVKSLLDAGFKQEGFLKGATIQNNKLIDYFIFGRINPVYLNNHSTKDKKKNWFKYNYNNKNRGN